MRITAVDTIVVPNPGRSYVFVLVRTDVGLTGLGEATLMGRERAVQQTVADWGDLLIGEDPLRREYVWQRLFLSDRRRTGSVQMGALAGIDVALWDIAGQAAGLPIHRLLGGPLRERVWCYTHCRAVRPEDVAEAFGPVMEAGWTAAKFMPIEGPEEQAEGFDTREASKRAARVTAAAREFVGADFELLIETHGRLRPVEFVDLAKRLEGLDPYFLEEPTRPEAVAPLRTIRDQVRVPLATGERLVHRWAMQPIIEGELVDYLQPDVAHAGGISEVWKIGAVADTHLIQLAPHNPQSPVNTMASLHVDFALPNFAIQEVVWPFEPRLRELFDGGPRIEGGYALPPEEAGLGIRLNETKARAWQAEGPADGPAMLKYRDGGPAEI